MCWVSQSGTIMPTKTLTVGESSAMTNLGTETRFVFRVAGTSVYLKANHTCVFGPTDQSDGITFDITG